jgi:hypothetical protein
MYRCASSQSSWSADEWAINQQHCGEGVAIEELKSLMFFGRVRSDQQGLGPCLQLKFELRRHGNAASPLWADSNRGRLSVSIGQTLFDLQDWPASFLRLSVYELFHIANSGKGVS